ncbi:hypothetical protein [Novosphingobium sp.]|uniref:hypothetical protein n=1 Tax=Novosphingobium sp. TaxID=1874826 RepID=UPI001EB169ED|nr:hypothetical protein [Novosphingobium sp.]MBK6801643.1 hypothetical protein [Novosphingobium sp.]MBK9009989.1 hypothetical protein [Novosphingobium sp.]
MISNEMTGYFLAIRAIGRHHRVEIEQARFEKIQSAWANLCNVLDLEESWDAVIQNYLDLEKGMLDAAARHMILSIFDYHNFQDIRLQFAVKLANLLSSCRAYLDHTPRNLNSLEPRRGETGAFRLATNREYDQRFGYRFMEALRNYSQHGGLPLHGASYGTRRREGEDEGMLQFSVATHVLVDKLRGNKSFKQSVLENVTEEKLPAEPLVRAYIEGVSCVHMELRNLLHERVARWMKVIRDAIATFSEGSPDGNILGLCAMQLGEKNQWIQSVPLVEDMLQRLEILQKRNRSLEWLTRSFVSNAPRPAIR